MNLQEMIGGLVNQVSGNQPSTVGAALSSLGADKIGELVGGSAGEMSSEQRGQMAGSLLSGFSASGIDLQSLLGKLGVNSAVADNPEQASPEDVAALAAHAHENHPGIFQSAMSFYEEHPTMVKTLGAIAVAAIAKHVADGSGQQ